MKSEIYPPQSSIEEQYTSLLCDAIAHLKELHLPVFTTQEEWQALHIHPMEDKTKTTALRSEQLTLKQMQPAVTQQVKTLEKKQEPLQEKPFPEKNRAKPQHEIGEEVKIKQLLKHTPLVLSDAIPDDHIATQIMNSWQKEQVLIFSCDLDTESLTMVDSLSRNIDQKLAKSKIFSLDQLKREKNWKSFLSENKAKLIIATQKFAQLDIDRNELGETPLIMLASASYYTQAPKEKINVWNQICSLLKR